MMVAMLRRLGRIIRIEDVLLLLLVVHLLLTITQVAIPSSSVRILTVAIITIRGRGAGQSERVGTATSAKDALGVRAADGAARPSPRRPLMRLTADALAARRVRPAAIDNKSTAPRRGAARAIPPRRALLRRSVRHGTPLASSRPSTRAAVARHGAFVR